MRDALTLLNDNEEQQAQTQHDANIAIAVTWWNGIKPATPTTRDEALAAFRFIQGLLRTETDRFRLIVLKKKLEEANEKFKERKRNG